MRRLEDKVMVGLLGAMIALGAVNITITAMLYHQEAEARLLAEGRISEFRTFREEMSRRITQSSDLHTQFLKDIEALRADVATDRQVIKQLDERKADRKK